MTTYIAVCVVIGYVSAGVAWWGAYRARRMRRAAAADLAAARALKRYAESVRVIVEVNDLKTLECSARFMKLSERVGGPMQMNLGGPARVRVYVRGFEGEL